MNTLNLLKQHVSYYTAANHPEIIHIEKAKFVSIIGKGSFTEEVFYQRIDLLKQVAQAVINLFQDSQQAFDMSVLEGLYWNDNHKYDAHSISRVFDTAPLSELNYRLMIRLPEYVTEQNITIAKGIVDPIHKKLFKGIEFFEYQEGKCLQMLHKGPFIYEIETLTKIEQFANENNLIKRDAHHEIYLVDFTKGGSQKNQKTILREPVMKWRLETPTFSTEFIIPEEFQNKLDEIPALKTAFDALTPGRQRAYILYFSAPKQSKTRESRVEKCMQQILNGKGLND